jgi:hypothetical protein
MHTISHRYVRHAPPQNSSDDPTFSQMTYLWIWSVIILQLQYYSLDYRYQTLKWFWLVVWWNIYGETTYVLYIWTCALWHVFCDDVYFTTSYNTKSCDHLRHEPGTTAAAPVTAAMVGARHPRGRTVTSSTEPLHPHMYKRKERRNK